MHRYTFPGITVHVSNDVHEEYKVEHAQHAIDFPNRAGQLADYILQKIQQGFLRKLFHDNQVLGSVLKRFRASKLVILDAHGEYENGVWCYYEGDTCIPIQEWIDEHDRRGQSLILCCCNVACLTPKTSHALLLLPDRSVSSSQSSEDGNAIFTVIHPKYGEIDSYILESFLPEQEKHGPRHEA